MNVDLGEGELVGFLQVGSRIVELALEMDGDTHGILRERSRRGAPNSASVSSWESLADITRIDDRSFLFARTQLLWRLVRCD
jgi:hypothetical protein